jgi:tetrapyrrole methylase family protein/MazG family protein
MDALGHQPQEPPATDTFDALMSIVDRLRSPGGCPWDLEQTHQSLKRNLLEECYEVLEAIDDGDPKKVSEEMGDLLAQVAFHADIAKRAGHFTIGDVLDQVNQKLVRRHPHVFGDVKVSDVQEVERNWERLKREEGSRSSPVDGVPGDMPSLAQAQLMQDRVARGGFDWDEASEVLAKVVEEAREVEEAQSPEERAAEIGDLLFALVNLARWNGVHAEDALRQANGRFRKRYRAMEELVAHRGLDFAALTLGEKEKLWQEAKGLVG